jgi:hypothetical protein
MESSDMRILPTLAALTAAAATLTGTAPALAHTQTFKAVLSGAAEAPANASTGTGTASVIIDDHDFTMDLTVSFSGLSGTVTASHIHCCTTVPGVSTAGVATVTPTFTGFPLGVTSGSYHHLFDMTALSGSWNNTFIAANGGTQGTAFSALLAGLESGKAYLNIHTSAVGSGEIRGFLQLAPVPEPGTWALMLGGLALLGCAGRQRRTGDR